MVLHGYAGFMHSLGRIVVIVDCLVGFSYFLDGFGLRVQARLSGRVFVSSRLASLVGLAPSLRSVALEPVARVCALCVDGDR